MVIFFPIIYWIDSTAAYWVLAIESLSLIVNIVPVSDIKATFPGDSRVITLGNDGYRFFSLLFNKVKPEHISISYMNPDEYTLSTSVNPNGHATFFDGELNHDEDHKKNGSEES